MIRSHRLAHRNISLALLLLLPLLALLGIVDRKPPPALAELPDQIRAQVVAPQMTLQLASDRLWAGLPVTSYLFADTDSYLLFLFPERVLPYPDLLVYWSTELPAEDGSLGANAVLLGALSTASVTRFELAPAMLESAGALFLYSLGHRREVGSVALPLNVRLSRGPGS